MSSFCEVFLLSPMLSDWLADRYDKHVSNACTHTHTRTYLALNDFRSSEQDTLYGFKTGWSQSIKQDLRLCVCVCVSTTETA